MDRADWIAYVTEEVSGEDSMEDYDPTIASGTFRGSVEQWPPPPDEEYPSRSSPDEVSGLSLVECLRWARERADRIAVTVIPDETYSAGDVPVSDLPPLPLSLEVVRRRSPGYAYLDRTEHEPEISWDVIIEATIDDGGRNGWEGNVTETHERWREALTRTGNPCLEMISSYESPFAVDGPDGEPGGWAAPASWPVAVVRVNASTLSAARAASSESANRAASEIGWETTPFISNDGYPTGSQLAGWNAHVE